MSFGPESLQRTPLGEGAGHIDYRLARRHLVNEFKRGRLSRRDLCEDDDLVLVSFVFGPRLPAHGRCVGSKEELAKLASRSGERVCYVVEVCPGCSWNHLVRTFALGLTAR